MINASTFPNTNNLQANTIAEIIQKLLENIVCTLNIQETYIYGADPCMGILSVAAIEARSTYHIINDKSPGQLFFWLRHDPQNQKRSGLEIHTPEQASASRKIFHP